MKSEDLLELLKWLGIVWGFYVSALTAALRYLSILPERWRESSAGRTALIKIQKEVQDYKDETDEEVRLLKKDLNDQRMQASQNWIKFIELQKQHV
jgi:hypothetical protein